jgi:hypothetical protein
LLIAGVVVVAAKLSQPPSSSGLIIGIVFAALALLLGLLEWRDLRRGAIALTVASLSLMKPGQPTLTMAWDELAEVTIEQLTRHQLFHLPARQLWLRLRPLDWKAFTARHPEASSFIDSTDPDQVLSLSLSQGRRRLEALDSILRKSGQTSYSGVSKRVIEISRALRRR